LPVLQVNSRSIDQKSGEIWTGQADLQPISFKSDRLLARMFTHPPVGAALAAISCGDAANAGIAATAAPTGA